MTAFHDKPLNQPVALGILLQRDAGGYPCTNVPHLVTHHSPTGYEWGYGGSGPADLALNIVEMVLHRLHFTGERSECFRGECFNLAFELHQEFKWKFISTLPRNGGTLDYQTVQDWVSKHL